MPHDDVQTLWQRYDARLTASMQRNALVLRGMARNRTQTAFGRLKTTLYAELAVNALAVILLGNFAYEHRAQRVVLDAAIVLDCFAIAILTAGIAQLVSLARLTYDEPIVSLAARFDRLRLLRLRATLATLIAAPLMWTPLLVVGVSWFGGAPAFDLDWLAANVAFGVAVPLAAVAVARFSARQAALPGWLTRTLDHLYGKNVRDAVAALEQLARDAQG